MLKHPVTALLPVALLLALPALAADNPTTEIVGVNSKPVVQAGKFMLVTAHPLATEAGHAILKQGGSAIDAAIAAQMVLNLVEPQSAGIGGGGFLLHYAAKKKRLQAFDGRETAPATALPSRFADASDSPLPFSDAAVGGRSVGVPGLLQMLANAHKQHGKLAWVKLFDAAIQLAEQGFPISPELADSIAKDKFVCHYPPAKQYFCDADGQPKTAGSVLKNPEFATTLRLVARQGAQAFYQGEFAKSIVSAVRAHPETPGDLTEGDLADYRAVERKPLCAKHHDYDVCSMPPPSSGGLAVLQILGITSQLGIAQYAPTSVDAIHLFSEAGRLAYADRDKYVADPDFIEVPVAELLAADYLKQRASLVKADKSMGKAEAGNIRPIAAIMPDETSERPSTTHLAVIDRFGNALSMTTSIEDRFGSRIMVNGFMLNNQLTDFAFVPFEDGREVVNRVGAYKRPRSSMAPIIAFDKQGKPLLLVGSPGGSNIINYVAQTLIGVFDWKLTLNQATALPHYGSRNGPTNLEAGADWGTPTPALQTRGHSLKQIEMKSGLHGMLRAGSVWESGVDPRREGIASGE